MPRIDWRCVPPAAFLLVAPSCSDVLGLHDLVQETDGGDQGTEGGDRPILQGSPAASDGATFQDSSAASDGASLAPSFADREQSDASAVATRVTAASVDAAPLGQDAPTTVADAGAGAVCSDCGSPQPACAVQHTNGVGQTFADCVPVGTQDETQARSACIAFTGNEASCTPQTCSKGNGDNGNGKASAKDNQAVCSTGAPTCECWTFAGSGAGQVATNSADACEPCAKGGAAWN